MKINWDLIDKTYNYAAMDSDGVVYLYESKPMLAGSGWRAPLDEEGPFLASMASEKGWRESLCSRPNYVKRFFEEELPDREFGLEELVKYVRENYDC